MIAVVLAGLAAYGTHLVFTAVSMGWEGLAPGPRTAHPAQRRGASSLRSALDRAGLAEVTVRQAAGVTVAVLVVGAVVGWTAFGGVVAPAAGAGLAGLVPVGAVRARQERRRAEAQDAWPRLIEEVRVRTATLGRSVPQALFEAGRRAPATMRPAFADGHREWLLTTDFDRAVTVLKAALADPTADAACETLLIAHEVGGNDLDRRLEALAHDRVLDVNGRKDARAKQAGARFARRFVLIVPAGMALAGLSIGDGRGAYQSPGGQAAVAAGVAVIGLCWWWAGRIMHLPDEQRVFDR